MSRYIFKHMSKEQIKKAKAEAKKRKNRRLHDGEFRRVFAQFRPKGDDQDDLPIVDVNKMYTAGEAILANARSLVEARKKTSPIRSVDRVFPQNMGETDTPLRRLTNVRSKIGELLGAQTFTNPAHGSAKDPKKFNRLTKREYQSLMKKAAVELGINEDKGYKIMELHKDEKYSPEELVEVILNNHELGWGMRKEYNKIIQGKRLDFGEKLSVLYYLMMRKTTRKPMCLLSKGEKTDTVRKGIVKPRGDIKERPFRLIPDDEYIAEVHKVGKRKKFDHFDKLDISRKIEWARYANLILDLQDKELSKIRPTDRHDMDIATFAMKYACKMSKVPEFKGIFSSAYWIFYRTFEYCNHMTNREYSVFYDMALEYLSVSPKAGLPVIDATEAMEKIIPTLKSIGLYKKFSKMQRKPSQYNDRINLEIATNLLLKGEKV